MFMDFLGSWQLGTYQTECERFRLDRKRMVDRQIVKRGVKNRAVLEAMRKVPRHIFVPPDCRDLSYRDAPVSIGYEQTISQPYVVAYMTEQLLSGTERSNRSRPRGVESQERKRVLEIGTGSGYQGAILASLGFDVFSIETISELAQRSRQLFEYAGLNIASIQGDGRLGWLEYGPFDMIMVTAGAPKVPPMLLEQLALEGRLIMPVGRMYNVMMLTLFEKKVDSINRQELIPVRFVPLVENV